MAELINRLDLLEKMSLSHKMHANNSREASLLDRDLLIVLEQPATTEREIIAKAIDECIKTIEETVWKDTDMLVESIRELKGGAE